MPWNSHLNMQNFVDFGEGPGEEHSNNQSPLLNMRERLFFSLFERISSAYSAAVPRECRKSIEIILLAFALVPLFVLIYIHVNFIQTPANCLAHISNRWPQDGVLRIQLDFKEQTYPDSSPWPCQQNSWSSNDKNSDEHSASQNINEFRLNKTKVEYDYVSQNDSNLSFYLNRVATEADYSSIGSQLSLPALHTYLKLRSHSDIDVSTNAVWPPQQYIIEYTLEYGFLKLSEASRQKLKIPVLVVALDPYDEKCFGNSFSQFLLRYVVGYSDVLMSSLKHLVDKDETKGFVRNVISGDQYRFVNKTLTWTSYVIAGLTMVAFTLSISMLLRYSHYQIFLFIVQVLHVLEFNFNASFSAASILTVVFALVGMEAIMSEFFNDSTTALYIILIVWIADQFDTVCSRNVVTKRHWLKFFYLYHFAFYAYDYRFNGQYSSLALFISWMFIQHSMIYFFHQFELVGVEQNIELETNDEILSPFNPGSSVESPQITTMINEPSLPSEDTQDIVNTEISETTSNSQFPNHSSSAMTPLNEYIEVPSELQKNQPDSVNENFHSSSVADNGELCVTNQDNFAHISDIT